MIFWILEQLNSSRPASTSWRRHVFVQIMSISQQKLLIITRILFNNMKKNILLTHPSAASRMARSSGPPVQRLCTEWDPFALGVGRVGLSENTASCHNLWLCNRHPRCNRVGNCVAPARGRTCTAPVGTSDTAACRRPGNNIAPAACPRRTGSSRGHPKCTSCCRPGLFAFWRPRERGLPISKTRLDL